MEYGSTLQALFLNELCIHFFFLLPLTDLLSFTRCSDRSSVFLPSATKMPAGQDCSRLAGGKPMASVGTQVGAPDFKKNDYSLVSSDSGILHFIFLAPSEKSTLVYLSVI